MIDDVAYSASRLRRKVWWTGRKRKMAGAEGIGEEEEMFGVSVGF